MATQNLQRVFRGNEFIATTPRTGSQGDAVWRTENMVRRGRGNHRYWEVLKGELDINESAPLVALTGTVAVTEDSAIVVGTGTLFLTECKLGQRIIIIDEAGQQTIPIFVKRVISDTQFECWRPSTVTLSGQTGWRMYRLFTLNQRRAMMLWGNAIELDKGSLLVVGNGELFINGASLPGTPLTATNEPQIALFDPAGTYSVFTLGMDTPAAPTLAAIAGGTKGMQGGNYSIVITPARKQTDGFNNPSQRADVTIATNDMVRITFPAMDTANGQNAWQIWVTVFTQSLGADLGYLNGPWRFLMMVTDEDVSSAGGTFDVEWLDAEVIGNELVSFDNDPPPQAEFIHLLNYTPVWLSCRGPSFTRGVTEFIDPSPGPLIAPAKPTNIEAAPAGIQFASSPPETIIGGVAAQGRIFLMTPNHLEIAQSTPDESVPILVRPYWNDGFANPEGVVFVNGNLYGFTTGGPAKSVGDGDVIEAERDWAAYMSEFTDDWTEEAGHVLVGYFPGKDAIAFFHVCDSLNDQGFWTTFVLLYGLAQGEWIGARRISQDDRDSIVCGVCTVGEDMHILMGGRRIG
jgi:hypothetical protein